MTNPSGELRPERFPLTLQLSVNLLRNTNRGTLTAEVEIVHRGRSTLVVDVQVFDDQRRLIAKLVATQPPRRLRQRPKREQFPRRCPFDRQPAAELAPASCQTD